METVPVRFPKDKYASLRTLAAMRGETPGVLLSEAFQEYLSRHEAEFTRLFRHAQKYVASQDYDGLTRLVDESRSRRVDRAVKRVKEARR
jgi:hypothetical protein